MKPNANQCELAAAVEPVVDRFRKRYKATQDSLKVAQSELDALLLFHSSSGNDDLVCPAFRANGAEPSIRVSTRPAGLVSSSTNENTPR